MRQIKLTRVFFYSATLSLQLQDVEMLDFELSQPYVKMTSVPASFACDRFKRVLMHALQYVHIGVIPFLCDIQAFTPLFKAASTSRS